MGLLPAVAPSSLIGQAQSTPVDIRGKVENIELLPIPKQGIAGRMRVEGAKQMDTQHDKAIIQIRTNTRVFRMVAGMKKAARLEDILEGSTVQVDFSGPVAESYPVQATAGQILILK